MSFGFLCLVVVIGLLMGGGWLALRRAGRIRRASGAPLGRIVYADTGDWRAPDAALFSKAYRLTGKPDYLVHTAQGTIPVEVKSGAAPESPYTSHVLQLAGYCLLVEDSLGQSAPHGLIRYGDGVVFRVDFTPELRRKLLNTMESMRTSLARPGRAGAARNHDEAARCAGCGYRDVCNQALV